MAEDNTTGAAPAAVTPPAPVSTERLTVPASAVFSDNERTLEVEKPAETPAGKPAAETPAVVPAEKPAETPAAETPAVVPAEKPAETPAEKPAPKATDIVARIGGKDYTQAELEAKLAERAHAPAAAPAAAAPAPEAPKPPTAEEITQRESTWCENFLKNEKLNFAPTAEEVETILSGGEDAAKLLAKKFNDIAARAVLLARKSVFNDMNPLLEEVQSKLNPVVASAEQVEVAAAEQAFVAAYPDFKPEMQTVKQVAEALLARYPNEVSKMTRDQFAAEVAAQADRILQQDYKRWNPEATNSWREARKAAAPAATPPAKPAAVAPAPAKPAAVAPKIAAPAANSPAATPSAGQDKNWSKQTAKSLAE